MRSEKSSPKQNQLTYPQCYLHEFRLLWNRRRHAIQLLFIYWRSSRSNSWRRAHSTEYDEREHELYVLSLSG